MGRRQTSLVALALLASGASHAQTLNPSPRDVISRSRALLDVEVVAVLEAERHAVDGRTFRLSYQPSGPGPDIQMGPDGRARYIRMTSGLEFGSTSVTNGGPPVTQSGHKDVVTFLHDTRTVARGCDGTPRGDELVLEYENDGAGWRVKARTRSAMEINDAAFDMLAGQRPVTTGPVQHVGTRTVRPFVAPWQLPEGALGGPPPGTVMALWIDIDSLLPRRWSLTLPAAAGLPDFGVVFTYLDTVDLRPPTVIAAPDCIG